MRSVLQATQPAKFTLSAFFGNRARPKLKRFCECRAHEVLRDAQSPALRTADRQRSAASLGVAAAYEHEALGRIAGWHAPVEISCGRIQPLAASKAFCSRALGCTPTKRSTTSPPLKIIKVGMLPTP